LTVKIFSALQTEQTILLCSGFQASYNILYKDDYKGDVLKNMNNNKQQSEIIIYPTKDGQAKYQNRLM
jgi:hypothetical protein